MKAGRKDPDRGSFTRGRASVLDEALGEEVLSVACIVKQGDKAEVNMQSVVTDIHRLRMAFTLVFSFRLPLFSDTSTHAHHPFLHTHPGPSCTCLYHWLIRHDRT